jgi:hypothetical protein
VWLSAPEPTRKTRRSSAATAAATQAPTARKSAVGAGLGRRDRHPALVALQEAEQVDGGVVDGQVRVVDGGDPALVDVDGRRRHRRGELGVTRQVVGDLAHPAGQLLGGVPPGSARLGRDDELDGREPVRVEHHHEVGLEHVEDLAPHPLQPRVQRGLPAVVERAALLVGEHDRRHVGEDRGPHHLTHAWSPP